MTNKKQNVNLFKVIYLLIKFLEVNVKNLKARDLVMCSLFVALIVVGTFIRVPIPVLPFTLQLLFTMLAGLLLGPELGATAVVAVSYTHLTLPTTERV